ncbi:MAG: hypothetical protein SV062_11170 [Thermodesulfobacteriota bacterium]|nr:hypothetical protein [Thermodesulfobacteriota bacterium]
MEQEKILYLRDVMNLSFRQIEGLTGISRKKASKIYQGYSKDRKKRICILDKCRFLIGSWFKEYPSLKAIQVYMWLQERGVEVSYPSVVQYTKTLRKKREKVYHPLNFLPGEEGQIDWFL